MLKSIAQHHSVDLVAFVQRPLLETYYPTLEEGLDESRRTLERLCRSVTFLPIAAIERPFGKVRTALEGLLLKESYMTRWLRNDAGTQALLRLAGERRYDLAHFDVISLAPYRGLLPAVPATLGYHNIESHMLLRRAEKDRHLLRKLYFWQEGKRLARYERRMADQFAGHITCSELDSARLRELMPDIEPICIPNGVDVEYFSPLCGQPKRHSLVFVSTLSWYPNVDAVLFLLRDIWPALKKLVPNVTLDIVGAGAPPSVVELAREHEGVTLHGFVPDIRPLVDAAAIFVCPIRDGGGTKLKVLDAFAMAKCVVAHPIACEGIDVTDGRDVVLAESGPEFARRLASLLNDDERRAEIGAAARELVVSRYTFDAIGSRLEQYLRELAGSDTHNSSDRGRIQ
ncbi:MAG TPA: glycosyltransferase [Steroidobacteraceae bacterium]|nr:glycosyltransferase [Steroidobacteraceae bacterium]